MTKPPNPQGAPKSWGRKPPAPRPHTNSGSSSTGSRTMALVAVGIFAPGLVAFLAAVGYVVAGHN